MGFDGGRLTVDLEAQRVVRDGVDVRLSPTEFRLLRYLMANARAARLGPYLTIYVGRVRQQIEQDPTRPRLITSRHGAGNSASFCRRTPPHNGSPALSVIECMGHRRAEWSVSQA